MSRPFSYNDENFTVIGNMLFIHIIVTEEFKAGSVIAVIPPEINKRLFSECIVCLLEGTKKNIHMNYGSYRFIRTDNNLVALTDISAHTLFKAIEPLKDI